MSRGRTPSPLIALAEELARARGCDCAGTGVEALPGSEVVKNRVHVLSNVGSRAVRSLCTDERPDPVVDVFEPSGRRCVIA
jgi:hypothetical protein